jgi:UDP-glucose:(heptosyl)LPS alpha-1,3-glucosyltransferase
VKVALVVHDATGFIGQGRYVSMLASHLASRHEVTVFANTVDAPVAALCRVRHVRAWRRGALTTVLTFPIGLRLVAARALREFDLWHTQGYCGGDPNVVTAHICVAAYLSSLRKASWRTRASLAVMAAVEARFYRAYRGPIIAVSAHVARELQDRYAVEGPIHVVPHGVDLVRFNEATRAQSRARARADLGVTGDETVALYVGDLTKAHTHLRALAAAAPEVRIAVVTGSPGYRWGASNVLFLPPVLDVERYYAAADALVFPSTYDAFGMVVLEALACGLPVFVSDTTGASSLVDGKNGLVLPLAEWVETTARALCDRDGLRSMGEAAAETARRHPWSEVAQAVDAVYREAGRRS